MRDQDEFRDDPRGKQQVSEQQPETQPDEDGESVEPGEGEGRSRQAGRDEAGEATGNPPNAG